MKDKITSKKYGGNDESSYAVFLNGCPKYVGLTKREIPHYKKLVEDSLKEKK